MESSEINIPPNEIFKIFNLDSNGAVKTIYIFCGGNSAYNLNELFSEIELTEFKVNNTQLIFSKQQIHKDDSIRILKKKIIQEFGIDTISYNEIYMFSIIEEKIKLYLAYQEITNNEHIKLDHNMLGQLLLNVNVNADLIDTIEKKANYNYDDLMKYINTDVSHKIKISLGQRFT